MNILIILAFTNNAISIFANDILKTMKEQVTPYQSGEGKKSQVSKMFDKIASSYDLLNRVTSMGIDIIWRRKAVNLLDKDHKIILDVATGTADVTIEIHKQLPNIEHIIGLDISPEMLNIGKQKVAKRGLSDQIKLVVGDSENLSFEDNYFDAVTVAFGVRNFENLQKGLQEIRRVLKPGGQLIVLEFSHPTVFPIKQLFNFYFRYILPTIGRVMSNDTQAYQYLFDSVQAFPNQEGFLEELKQIGFKSNQCKPLTFGICTAYSAIK